MCTPEPAPVSRRTPTKRAMVPAIVAGLIGFAIAANSATAQRLNLDGPPSPVVGDRSALLSVEARLLAERDAILAQSDGPDRALIASAQNMRAAMRDLAAALLAAPDPHTGDGAIRALIGLRIADAMAEIDALASTIAAAAVEGDIQARASDPSIESILRWERTRAGADALTRRCQRITQQIRDIEAAAALDIATLDASLAEIAVELRALTGAETAIDPAWPATDRSPPRGTVDAAQLAVRPDALDASSSAAMAAAFDALRATEDIPDLRHIRRAAAWRIADAAHALDMLAAARISPTVTSGLSAACEAIADPNTRDAGLARIEAIAALGLVADRATAIEADGVDIVALREALGVLAIGLGLPIDAPEADDPATIRIIAAIDRMIDDIAAAPRRAAIDFKDARFNRAWRALVKRHEAIERSALELAARCARAPSILGTPEWVSAAGGLRESRRTLERIASISDWIAELRTTTEGPIGGTVRAGAADRLTVIRKGIGYEAHQDGALVALAEWDAMRTLAAGMPGEDLLRAADPRLNAVTRSRSAAIVRIMELARADWVGAWARAEEMDRIEADQRVHLLERLGEALIDAAALRDADAPQRISLWAPMRLSPAAFESLRARAEAVLAEACAAAIDNQQIRLTALLDEWDRTCIAVRVVARVNIVARDAPDWPESAGVAGLIAALGPPPPDAWLGDERGSAAMVGIWAAELEAADAENDRGMADAIVRWMNHLAEPMVAALRREAR